jgi:hypothetical protein
MGGFGSGDYDRPLAKETTVEFPQIDCRVWSREGKLNVKGPQEYFISEALPFGTFLRVHVDGYRLDLCFRQWINNEPFDWGHCSVRTVFTWCHYGGRRVWFRCPMPGCGRRVAVLYLARAEIACRKCLDLRYQTQRQRSKHRAIDKARRIRSRLDGSLNLLSPSPERPKGMHFNTYLRLLGELSNAEARVFSEIANSPLMRLGPRF